MMSGNKLRLIFHDHYGKIAIDRSVSPLMRMIGPTFVDHYIAVSPELQRWATEQLGIAPASTEVLANAINLRRYTCLEPLEQIDLGQIEQPLLAACVANLRPQKDHATLFRALGRSQEARRKLHILAVGLDLKDNYSKECRRIVKELDLQDNISFLGSRTDIPQILSAVDFGLLSSRSESGPITLLEYMAVGLPFLVTQTGQIAQVVQEKGLPYFVTPEDVAAYAAGLDELLSLSDVERRLLGQKGKSIVTRLFDIRQRVKLLINIYQELLSL
jgi:glycosyltransferase involved in cell wall biosynthesis